MGCDAAAAALGQKREGGMWDCDHKHMLRVEGRYQETDIAQHLDTNLLGY